MKQFFQNKIFRWLCIHIGVLLALLFILFVWKCPVQLFLGIPCPGCGVSRAYLACLRLDFREAFRLHPLFFTVAPTVLYAAHRRVLLRRFPIPRKAEYLTGGLLILAFFVVYIIRLPQFL